VCPSTDCAHARNDEERDKICLPDGCQTEANAAKNQCENLSAQKESSVPLSAYSRIRVQEVKLLGAFPRENKKNTYANAAEKKGDPTRKS